jgi:hypothetical protein
MGMGFRNRIINGAMVIDQRNAGASVTPTNDQYILDRYFARLSAASKYSVQQNAGSVTPPTGFTNYLGVTSLSAYSISTSDYFAISQRIEGFNIADLGWGSASAQPVTLSFWVRSSLTGTFGVTLLNSSAGRAYPATYTISAANTWEQKTITIAGDTSGTWLTTSGIGIGIQWGLGYGASNSTTGNVWNAGTGYMATGATSVVGTNGATWYVTGVQLEKGSTATSFDYRPYGTELALCQRYFYSVTGLASQQPAVLNLALYSTTTAYGVIYYPVPMRVVPTLAYSSLSDFLLYSNSASRTPSNIVGGTAQTNAAVNCSEVVVYVALALTAGNAGWLRIITAATTAFLSFSAEL